MLLLFQKGDDIMFKMSLDIGKIGDIRIKFHLILESDPNTQGIFNKYSKQWKIINDYQSYGNRNLTFSPRPFVTLDINDTVGNTESWSNTTSIVLNRLSLFQMIHKLEKFIKSFEIKELFYLQNKKLHVDVNLAKSEAQTIVMPQKRLCIMHCVVPDKQNEEIEYEGGNFMFNTIDNFCLLTYDEILALKYEIGKIDMSALSLQLINIYLMEKLKSSDTEIIEETKTSRILYEKKDNDNTTLPPLPESKTIPDI